MFKFYRQHTITDCGPTCLRMVARYYGKNYNIDNLRYTAGYNKSGTSLLGLHEAAKNIGFKTDAVQLTVDQLEKVTLPCILHWDQNHFVVLVSISSSKNKFRVADPAKGIVSLSKQQLLDHWLSKYSGEDSGTALLLEPSSEFYKKEDEKDNKISFAIVLKYLRQSKWELSKVVIALLLTLLFQLIFPFLTQSIVDNGINARNLQYVTIVLVAQLMLTFSRTIIEFIRSRVLLRISVMINASLLSDFWIKLTRLPISYFDSYHTGDTMQRLGDGKRIESFLTGSTLNTFFSLFSFIIFAIILVIYNIQLFFIFLIGSIIYFLWIRLFLAVRRKLNYQNFHLSSSLNNASLQLVQGMQEIKLHGAEQIKRWEWEALQAGVFKFSFKTQSYNQLQQAGALLINEGKNIFITFLVAKMVIDGQLTFGAMLAIQYIIGQLSNPIEQFAGFVQSAQDAKISLERLNEIHRLADEEPPGSDLVSTLPPEKSLSLANVSFSYPGIGNEPVLKNINLVIPENKTTAIVGVSGSGKTTLIKLLLKFYDSYDGEIRIGDLDYKDISPSFLRKQCGTVLQDGFIFNDTIARNIAVGDQDPDMRKLADACKAANILSFIESLPNGLHTRLGSDGVGISEGQKQRLFIARAVYKEPHYLFFDEATNSLDANNEKIIVENLYSFFQGRTVVVVAHRLSTVRNAAKIVVLNDGGIAEEGTHEELSALRGQYYELVKNQLALGS